MSGWDGKLRKLSEREPKCSVTRNRAKVEKRLEVNANVIKELIECMVRVQ